MLVPLVGGVYSSIRGRVQFAIGSFKGSALRHFGNIHLQVEKSTRMPNSISVITYC